jgi:glycoside/pentoside/hexuronide:cation symporter, GPH family
MQLLGENTRSHYSFFSVYALNFFALSIPIVLVIFFVRDYLQAQSFLGLFLALYFIAAISGMALCRILAKRYSPLLLWRLSMLLACMSFIWVLFLQPGQITIFAIICVASGLCFAADLLFPASILTTLLHHNCAQHNSGISFSLYSFIAKACLALASLCTLWLLGKAGFVPSGSNNNTALLVLRILYALVPCSIKLVTALLLPYLISGEKYDPTHSSHPIREHPHV